MARGIQIKNRKASFDYFFERELNAGIQLVGTEVKSIIYGKISLVDSYCYFKKGELYMKGVNIAAQGDFSHEPDRERKLLLKRKELNKLEKDLSEGMTIVVKRIFSNDRGKIKAEIALAKGKKNYDKRNSIKEREIDRELKRV
jgi:SsrA-binding protein